MTASSLPASPRTITLALTGASGLPYGVRLLECLLAAGCRVWLLYSQAALRLAVDQGLAFYNGKIAGKIEVAGVEGSLGTRFVLRGVRVSDRVARPLVTAEALTVDLSPWALLRGKLVVEELGLDVVDVFLFSHVDGSAFGDLAIPGPEKPPREGPGVGPDLPLDITVARLALVDVDVFSSSGQPLAEEVHLTATAHGIGQAAEVDILEAKADLPGSQLTGLGLAARWTDPEVTVTAHAATNLGRELGLLAGPARKRLFDAIGRRLLG